MKFSLLLLAAALVAPSFACSSGSGTDLPSTTLDGGSDAPASGGSSGAAGSGAAAGAAGTPSAGAGGVAGSGGAAGGGGFGNTSGSGGGGTGGGSAGSGGAGGCGDGAVGVGEQCDGINVAGHTCATVLGPSATGTLGCTSSCMFDTGSCCLPACGGKQCGTDGCGGVCGTCPSGYACQSNSCVCEPNCSGKQCGSNGCGGSCGTCSSGSSCVSGQCQCTPNCAGKQCGSNGCGGSCGACGSGTSCNAQGQCTAPGGCTPPAQCSSSAPSSGTAQYCLPLDAYTACVHCSASCGLPQYGYQCTSGGGPPGLSGCVHKTGGGTHCCPQAACLRATPWDNNCALDGLPPYSYTCHPSATIPSGCKQRQGAYYCCPS